VDHLWKSEGVRHLLFDFRFFGFSTELRLRNKSKANNESLTPLHIYEAERIASSTDAP
jgi:hypothetical protein